MKKYSKIAYITVILIIIGSGFAIYKVSGQDKDINIKEKAMEEIKYLEGKMTKLFNQMNNINFEGYTISTNEIKKDSEKGEKTEEGASGGGSKDGGEEKSSESESSNNSGSSEKSTSSSGSGEEENKSNSQDKKQYELKEKGILTSESEIDWEKVKNEIENIYTSLATITLDLYQTNTKQEDILKFNNEFDNLTKAAKEENKEATLTELSKLYDYIPKFADSCIDNEITKAKLRAKNNIFKAYSLLDKEDWNSMSSNINIATQEFTKLLTGIDNQDSNKQFTINKVYVQINELQNAVHMQDKEIFLIKYKNLLEELQNI